MIIGAYKTTVPNSGLGGEAWQLYECDPSDEDGGRILAYLRSDATVTQILATAAALAPGAEVDWVTEPPASDAELPQDYNRRYDTGSAFDAGEW